MITKMHYIHEIIVNLSVLRYVVECDARKGFYDIPKACENLFKEIFNIAFEQFGWKFENLNDRIPNFPAIDLGDANKKIGIQITCQKDSSKIQDTLKTYESSSLNLSQDYKHLFIFLLTRKPNYTKKFSFPVSKMKYNKKHIYSIDDFIDYLDNLDVGVLERLFLYIKNNIRFSFDSASPSYKSISKDFPEFGSRKHQSLSKLGVSFPDKEIDEIFRRIDKIALCQRLVIYTFLKKCDDKELVMDGGTFNAFLRDMDYRRSDVKPLFDGLNKLLWTDENTDPAEEKIHLLHEDSWRLIKDNVDEIWWEQLIVYADFTLLD